jgi:hypothetical protein
MPDAESPAGVPSPAAACLLLGVAVALLTSTLPDAVLMPAVDRWAPRHLGGALLGACLAIGWLAGAGRRPRAIGPRALIALGLLALLGCFLASWVTHAAPDLVAAGLRGEGGLPYYAVVVLAALAAGAPAALPLGALLATVPGPGFPRQRAALLVGAATGFAIGPPLVALLLGAERTLQVVGLLAASAAVLQTERRALALEPGRLGAGAALALVGAGAAALVGTRMAEGMLDRGTLVGPAFATLVCLGAAAGGFLRALPSAPLWLAAAAAAVPLAFPVAPLVLVAPRRDALTDLAQVALPALPLGLALGAVLAQRAGRLALGWLPALLLLPAPILSWALLPRLDPRPLAALLALPVALLLLRDVRRHAMAYVALATVLALSFAGAGPRAPAHSLPAARSVRLADGVVSQVTDPATDRALIALDGRAPFGRSAGQDRRLAHLPLLLHEDPQTVLVIASDGGDVARAAWEHAPQTLHWLRPLPAPAGWDSAPWPGDHAPTTGSERQFLSVPRGPYDVIVMAPDPRAGRRGEVVASVEFFEIARRRLAPGGVLWQWWVLADMDITAIKAVIASAQLVFPQLYLLTDQPRTRRACLGLLLTDEPLSVPPARIDARLRQSLEIAADFERIGVDGLAILCQVTADRGLLELLAPREEALRDARPELGVRGALRSADSAERLAVGLTTVALHRRDPMPWVEVSAEARAPVSAIVRDRYRSWQHLYAGALDVGAVQGPAGTPFDREAPRATPLAEADALLDALVGLPDWAYLRGLLLGIAARLQREERYAEAEQFLRRAVEKDTGSAVLRYALANIVALQGRGPEARELYLTVLAFAPDHSGARSAVEALGGR